MQRLGQVLEGSGAHTWVRIRKVPVQMLEGLALIPEVAEGSGADAEVRFWKVPVQWLGQVLEGSGDAQVRFRKVPVQVLRSGSGRFGG